MRLHEIFDVKEVTIDNKAGAGSVPDNQNVDYLGLRVQMKPSIFLKLAAHLGDPQSAAGLADYIKQGGAIGAPFLSIDIPEEWFNDEPDYSLPARVSGHEGRNRMIAVQKIEGDDPVEVHLFFRGGLRRRHLTPAIIDRLQHNTDGIFNQDKKFVFDSPLFTMDLKEDIVVLNELFAKPYTWEKLDDEEYGFETASGKKYKVLVISESFSVHGLIKRAYWVEFGLVKFGAYKYDIERTGDAFNVFATVAAIIRQHLASEEPLDYIFFTASEPSRMKLYDAFMKLVPKFLPGWQFYKTEDNYGDRRYIIKNTSVEDDS